MAKSLTEVLGVLGDDGQSVGGSVVVHYEGKNELVAYHNSEDGGFIVTEKGEEIIEAYQGKDKPKSKPKDKPKDEPKGKDGKPESDPVGDLDKLLG